MPKSATCKPTPQVVELKPNNNSNVLYIPSCTRVERCGGCCIASWLSCQPSQTEMLTFQIIIAEPNGLKSMRMAGKEIVLVEQHTKCKCSCKLKKEVTNIIIIIKNLIIL